MRFAKLIFKNVGQNVILTVVTVVFIVLSVRQCGGVVGASVFKCHSADVISVSIWC